MGSVPRSMKFPLQTHDTNITGFFNLLISAHQNKVSIFVFAFTYSVYGSDNSKEKIEGCEGECMSVYTLSKP